MTDAFAERINRELGNRGFWDAAFTHGIANLMRPSSQEKRDKAEAELTRIISEAALAALPPSSGWEPIETAPRDGTRVLLDVGDDEPVIAGWCFSKTPYAFEGWSTGWQTVGGYDAGFATIGDPTHWMPIPPPPSREGV